MSDTCRRVLFLAPGFSEAGGCASHARKIAEGLAARGWKVDVIARLGAARRPRRRRSEGLTVTEVPGFGRRYTGGALYLLVALPMALIRRPPAVFMAMQLGTPATVAGTSAALLRRPAIVFSTSTGPTGEVAFVARSRLGFVRRALLARASLAVAQSEDGACELRTLLPRTRVAVVPTPVIMPQAPPAAAENPIVTYTGRLVRGKNLELLLDVWKRILLHVPDAELLLVGTGAPGDPTEHQLRARVADDPALSRSVTMTGWVDDVTPYLERTDVYVFPSGSEGMSNALLEACALERVVVLSDIPANRAVVGGGDYPLLFDPADAVGFERALLEGLLDDDRRRAARAQIGRRIGRFQLHSVLDEIEHLLRLSCGARR